MTGRFARVGGIAWAVAVVLCAASAGAQTPGGEPDADDVGADVHGHEDVDGQEDVHGHEDEDVHGHEDEDVHGHEDVDVHGHEDVDGAGDDADGEAVAVSAKAVVVVAGDPDEATRARAVSLERALADGGIALPTDADLRAALRGEPQTSEGDDGLGPARAERRRLGFGDDDAAALGRIGRLTGAHVVLRIQGTSSVVAFDVAAGAFYEPSDGDPGRYAIGAARAAARREARGESSPAAVPTPREVAENQVETPDEPAERPARAFFRKNWPYVIAGVLLAGALAWVIVSSRQSDDAPPPVLRFRPGDVP